MKNIFYSIITLLITTNIYSQCWKSIGRIDGDTVPTSFAIKEDGTLWVWGYNYGLYGNGSIQSSALPIKVGSDTVWKSIVYSQSNVFGIKTDGTLWAWGGSSYGVLGNGASNSTLVPLKIGVENQWKEVSTAWGYTIALKNNGTLWYWGGKNDLTPTKIGIDSDWKSIYQFYHNAFVIKNNGTLWSFNNDQNSNPKMVKRLGSENDFKQVDNNYAIKTDGKLWYYGYQDMITAFLKPINQVGNNSWEIISGGYQDTTFGITTDGALWKIVQGIATRIGTETNWKAVSVGPHHQIALKTDGTIYTWGTECCGEFGNGYVDGLPIALPKIVNTPGCLASVNDISMSEDAVNVYPNPTVGLFTISSKEKVVENITIKNTEGRTVLFIQNSNGLIDIQNLEKGAYFLEFKENNTVKSKLIIKE